ncbi:MAG TPA: hypothetical protein VK699_09205 [Terriglobales bacterium]|jgi:hypothetical protein|nr:hypothetical protein [Terriglobales bacterium]
MSEATELKTAKRGPTKAQWTLAASILAITVAVLLYRILVWQHLEQTSALFIGIPSVLAIILALTPRAETTVGMICKVITIAMLISGIFLGEGFICILMASPIFFAIGILIGVIINAVRKPEHQKWPGTNATCLLLIGAFTGMSLEGTSARLSFPQQEEVAVTRALPIRAVTVENNLAAAPDFNHPLPAFLRLKFPRPVEAHGAGLNVGDRRIIHFAGGEGKPGDLVMEVVEHSPGHVRFHAVSDHSKIAHWMTWEDADVSWKEVTPGQTTVEWKIRFRRELSPAWYFGPWEHYAVRLAAGYLIDTTASAR